jgi:hypothetical protein
LEQQNFRLPPILPVFTSASPFTMLGFEVAICDLKQFRKRGDMGKLNLVRHPVDHRILLIRGQRVIVDTELAALYAVSAKRLNEQVKRNLDRFPDDFLFQLTEEEYKVLRSQFATSNPGRGGRRYLPFAFTEHGAIMAATVLNSSRAVEMSVFVVRAFVRLREVLGTQRHLAAKIDELERKLSTHDRSIQDLLGAIRQMVPASAIKPVKPKKIGFQPRTAESSKAMRAAAGRGR